MPTAATEEFAATAKYMVVDSDSHVVETERTWQFMDLEDEKYRSILAFYPMDLRI